MLNAFADGGDVANRQKANEAMIRDLELLRDILHESDRPNWISVIERVANKYKLHSTGENSRRLLQTLANVSAEIKPIVTSDTDEANINFDALYERFRAEVKLDELFDELATLLKKIVESGEVDRISVVATLQEILGCINENRDGSYSAVRWTTWLSRFGLNLCRECADEIPVLKQCIGAWERTQDDLEDRLHQVDAKANAATVAEIAARVPEVKKLAAYVANSTLLLGAEAAGSDAEDAEFTIKEEGSLHDSA
jgi:hypothetical protein